VGLLDSQQNRASLEALAKQPESFVREGRPAGDALPREVHLEVLSGVLDMLSALGNIRVAATHLRQIGARAYSRPRRIGWEQLLVYHNTAALHEAGVFRNRLIRVFDTFAEYLEATNYDDRKEMLKTVKKGFMRAHDALQKLRDDHVHDVPFKPPALDQYRSWMYIHPGKERLLVKSYKHTARVLARGWLRMASHLEDGGGFFLDLGGLVADVHANPEQVKSRMHQIDLKVEAMKAKDAAR
jgi:hypothetical protein